MYIIDGIAYAGEQTKAITVMSVKPMSEYKLWIRFSNGDEGDFDGAPLLKDECFKPLVSEEAFSRVYIDYGTLTWDGGIDISSEYVYEHSLLVKNEKGA